MKYKDIIKKICFLLLITLALLPYRAASASENKEYLIIFEQQDGTYKTFDNLVYKTSDNTLLVKAKSTAKALGLTYQNVSGSKKGCIVSSGNKQLIFTRNSKTYYYSTGKTTKKLSAEYKQSLIDSTNMIHYKTLSAFYGCSYFNTENDLDYYSRGYKGVIVYSEKKKNPDLPDASVIFGINVKPYVTKVVEDTISVVRASVSVPKGTGNLKLYLSEVLEAYEKINLPSDGIYGYGYCEGKITIKGLNEKGKVVGEMKIKEKNFLIDFYGAKSLIVSGNIKNLVIGFTPEKPVMITDTVTYQPKDISWLSPDGYARKYFVIPPYTAFNFYNWITQVPYNKYFQALSNNQEPDDFNSAYQILSVVFKISPNDFIYGEGFGIQFLKWDKVIDNSVVTVYDTKNNAQSENYESEVVKMIGALKKVGLNKYFDDEIMKTKMVIKVKGGVPHGWWDYIAVEPIDTDLDIRDDYYVHLHEMTHYYEAQKYHYGFRITAWVEGIAMTLAEKAMNEMNIPTNDFDTLNRPVIHLINANQHNFEDYFLTASGDDAYVIGYYFIKFLNNNYGDDVILRILKKVYEANIPAYEWKNQEYDKKFAECIKAVTSKDVFEKFVKSYITK